jgi:Cu+-exporting ATPase
VALETAGGLCTIVFERTGTLSIGQPEVTDFERLRSGPLLVPEASRRW